MNQVRGKSCLRFTLARNNPEATNLEQQHGHAIPEIKHQPELCLAPEVEEKGTSSTTTGQIGILLLLEPHTQLHTFPVKRSHKRPSGKGSPSGFAAGNSF